jgi:ATP-binding cassette subfamily F protein 3
LATQVWELRNNELQIFPGSFVEWEAMRAERMTNEAKQLRADDKKGAERAVRQRECEREQKEREKAAGGDPRKLLRAAEKALADAELRVATVESTIADLTEQLDNPSLYDTPAGVKKAAALGRQLDEEREQLEDAMHEWSTAEEYVAILKKK